MEEGLYIIMLNQNINIIKLFFCVYLLILIDDLLELFIQKKIFLFFIQNIIDCSPNYNSNNNKINL